MNKKLQSVSETFEFGKALGARLRGGEVLELIGDVGAGKTTFTKGLAAGLGITESVQSPTFTISRIYAARDGIELGHYDFYRLSEPGVLKMEIEQVVHDAHAVTVIEWGGIIEGVLPEDRLRLLFRALEEQTREVELTPGGVVSEKLIEGL